MIGVDERRSSLRAFAPSLALLAGSVLINYIDRGNLGVAAPMLKGELRNTGRSTYPRPGICCSPLLMGLAR
jgi:hypothetical protein